jgi:ferritin-like metal-binding protein YciE
VTKQLPTSINLLTSIYEDKQMKHTSSENILDWLRDAHALEEQTENVFSGQADRLKDYPGLSTKFEAELNYIRDHKVLLAARIEQLGSSTSVIKDTAAKVVAGAQNISGMAVSDEPVKGILAIHALTQLAIGSYKILIAATEASNDSETRQICETILAHTETRAKWIETELEAVTKNFLLNAA